MAGLDIVTRLFRQFVLPPQVLTGFLLLAAEYGLGCTLTADGVWTSMVRSCKEDAVTSLSKGIMVANCSTLSTSTTSFLKDTPAPASQNELSQ